MNVSRVYRDLTIATKELEEVWQTVDQSQYDGRFVNFVYKSAQEDCAEVIEELTTQVEKLHHLVSELTHR